MSRLTVDFGQILDQPPVESDEPAEQTANAEVVFKGRNVEIPDHYRTYVSQNSPASNGSIAPSISSMSSSNTRPTGDSASPVNAWRSPPGVAGR